MRIKLTPEEWEVLWEVLVEADDPSSAALAESQPVLTIDEGAADAYRNRLQADFEIRGMDESYEPTGRGRILESLIDKLFTG